MAVSFGEVTVGGGGTSTTCNFTKPAALADGNYLVVGLMTGLPSATITPPSGFTLIRETDLTASSLLTYYKYITDAASEIGLYTFTANSSIRMIGHMVRLIDTDSAAPIPTTGETIATITNAEFLSANEASTIDNNGYIVLFGGCRDTAPIDPIVDDGAYTKHTNSLNSNIQITTWTKPLVSAGASGAVELNYDAVFGSMDEIFAAMIAVNPILTQGRFEAGAEFRGLLNKEFHLASGRFEVGAEFRGEFYWDIEGRFEAAVDMSDSTLLRDHLAYGRFEAGSDFSASLSRAFHIAAGRFEAGARFKDGYVGQGTGLTWTFPASVDPSEYSAYELQKFLSQLREGDEFPGYFPLGGVLGKTARVRIVARRYNDSLSTPDLEVQLIENNDPELINRLKQDTVIPFIPKTQSNLFRNVVELRRNSQRNVRG